MGICFDFVYENLHYLKKKKNKNDDDNADDDDDETMDILPYRFKVNSSQKSRMKENKKPLWYNFNFFHTMPEYHHVGQSEMIVSYELQIGLSEEINSHRKSHVDEERMGTQQMPFGQLSEGRDCTCSFL